MRKLKEVLRLHSLGMSQHQIARSCSISQSTVHDYVCAAQAAGIQWPLPEDWGDPQIGEALFPRQRRSPDVWRKHPEPDWAGIHKELQTHKNLTLQLIWQEKRESDPEAKEVATYARCGIPDAEREEEVVWSADPATAADDTNAETGTFSNKTGRVLPKNGQITMKD